MTSVNYLPPQHSGQDMSVELDPSDTINTAFLKGFKQAYILSQWLYEGETLLARMIRLNPDYFNDIEQ